MTGVSWKRFNWLDALALPAAAAAMRVAWLAPVAHLAFNNPLVYPTGTRYTAWLMLAVLVASALLTRLLQGQPQARLRMALTGLLAVVAVTAVLFGAEGVTPLVWVRQLGTAMLDMERGFHPALLAALLTAGLWLRGQRLANDDTDDVWRGFQVGMAALVGVALVMRSSIFADAPALDLIPSLGSFLLWGLLTLALANSSRALWLERLREGHAPGLSRYWLAVVAFGLGIVVVGGMLVGLLLAPQALARLLKLVGVALTAFFSVLAWVATGLVYLIFLVIGPLIEGLHAKPVAPKSEGQLQFNDLSEQFRELNAEQAERATAGDSGTALVIIVGAVVVLLLVVLWRRRSTWRLPALAEERETVWTRGLLRRQLAELVRRRPRRARPAPYLTLDGVEAVRALIRRLYQQLLAAARGRGWPRLRGQTPSAYARALAVQLPGAADALGVLTNAYQAARYAPQEPTPDDATRAQTAWEDIQAALKSD